MSRDVLAECVWNRKFRPPRARWTRTCQHPAKLQLRPEHGVRLTSSYALGYRLELTSAQDDGQPAP